MIRFNCDYSEGAHPRILERLAQTNLEQLPGYGQDTYCLQAAETIKQLCAAPQAAVHFISGGTQTNLTVIAAFLRSYQGVLAPDCGHINVHEAGAIEMTGHRILTAPHRNGKITAEQVSRLCREPGDAGNAADHTHVGPGACAAFSVLLEHFQHGCRAAEESAVPRISDSRSPDLLMFLQILQDHQ